MNRTEFLEHLSVVCEVKPETIENFKDSPDTLFNMACEWEDLIGFGMGTLIFGNVAVINQNQIK